VNLIETRGNQEGNKTTLKFSEAILSPMASFGGLYAPNELPDFGLEFIKKHIESSYKELAKDVLKSFEIDIDDSLIDSALSRYDEFDNASNPVPVVKVKDDLYISELYHGPTRAFKDMALQPFGVILSSIAKARDENYLIMAATSGDTGPATLETFKNKDNIKVACLYPDGGTSDVQRLQMVTEDAPNLEVLGIKGNFDDAQAALKSLLSSDEFNQTLQKLNIKLSAANSVNFGRIIFQTIYHIHSYLELLRGGAIKLGDKIYLIVPSGNFGNALGAYYVKKAGVPIEKILISSNSNNVLTELINEGRYDLRDKELIATNSPAMDILKSSNVERVLFDKFGADRTKELMDSLAKNDFYELTKSELEAIREDFDAINSTDKEALEIIQEYLENGYLLDPHTATCIKAYNNLKAKNIPTVAYSTAEWTKFSPTIAKAVGYSAKDDEDALNYISSKYNKEITQKIANLFDKVKVHNKVIEKYDIMNNIKLFLEK
jgi:threonine synthase